MKILITGAAGFIGYHLCKRLLENNADIVGVDNLNAYYDVRLKLARLGKLGIDTNCEAFYQRKELISLVHKNFCFRQLDISSEHDVEHLFNDYQFDIVINLAAQAGVRYSIEAPMVYVQSNIIGFLNILENCKNKQIKHLIYASSSSVYGNNENVPFNESDTVDNPVSMYAATKKSNELMAHTYSHLYNLPTTGLRFFTVYGPWGRPDMAPFLFAKSILEGKPIKVFNGGDLYRDFTYIDDIVDGINKVLSSKTIFSDKAIPYSIFNIGNNQPVSLIDFIKTMEKHCGKIAIKENYPMQQGDVYKTFANIDKLQLAVGYKPQTNLNDGLEKFVLWFKKYYGYND
jgi:UDP-glucuronate 4-epimerase